VSILLSCFIECSFVLPCQQKLILDIPTTLPAEGWWWVGGFIGVKLQD